MRQISGQCLNKEQVEKGGKGRGEEGRDIEREGEGRERENVRKIGEFGEKYYGKYGDRKV